MLLESYSECPFKITLRPSLVIVLTYGVAQASQTW